MQYVSIGGVKSDKISIKCGVPQGSVLGPLLFLLYINDFSHCSKILDIHLFADDSNLFLSDKNLINRERVINCELVKVKDWLNANKLTLNVSKSNFVIFHSHKKKVNHNLNISINDVALEQKQNTKYLGIIMDSNLNLKNHVHQISAKVSKCIGILSKLRYYLDRTILKQLYYAFLYPYLTYGLVVWGNTYHTNIYPIIILQKRAIRIMTHSKFDDHTSPLFKSLNILKFTDLLFFHNALLMYQYHEKSLPPIFDDFFKPIYRIHSHNTRLASRSSLHIPQIRGAKYNQYIDDYNELRYKEIKIIISLFY